MTKVAIQRRNRSSQTAAAKNHQRLQAMPVHPRLLMAGDRWAVGTEYGLPRKHATPVPMTAFHAMGQAANSSVAGHQMGNTVTEAVKILGMMRSAYATTTNPFACRKPRSTHR